MSRSARFWRELLNNWDTWLLIVGGFAIGTAVFGWDFLHGQLNISSLTLAVLGLIAVSILRDRRSEMKRVHQSLHAFEQQDAACRHLIGIVNEYGAKEAVLLQYSCTTSSELVRILLNQGARVTVFIQHEDTAANLVGSQVQVDRIREAVRSMQRYLSRNRLKADKLKIYKFRTLGTVSAIKIDHRVLCMGWYTYERVDPTVDKHYGSDTIAISGHDRATVMTWGGTGEFEALNKTFNDLEEHYRCNAEEVPL